MINQNLLMLLKQLKMYSESTYNHSIAVAYYCGQFSKMLGLSEESEFKLRIAGLFHDIGKLCIPIEILEKPGKLTIDEYENLKMHPIYSVNLLSANGYRDEEIFSLILSHHEKLNGLGYPNGLDDKTIPLLTRILTICDCYDAMKSKRSYKDAKSLDYITSELVSNSNTQFDSYYVKMFISYLNENKEKRLFMKS